jgi:sporulation protein YlmC with PRC-barrel domain
MTIAKLLPIGSPVTCADGDCGELRRVVIDPLVGLVTHLVVEPRHERGTGRLVPVELVSSAVPEIRLTCSVAQFAALDRAEESQFLPASGGQWGFGEGQVLSWPYYGLGAAGSTGDAFPGLDMEGLAAGPLLLVDDCVPAGEVEVRRGDRVHATDGDIGQVQGLIMDVSDRKVSHVLLQEGHLWGKKTVAIPISEVESLDDGVHVKLDKSQVKDLPAVDVYALA